MSIDHSGGVTLVIAAHDEEACIATAVEAARAVLSEAGFDFEVIVVDDGSADRTPAELERLSSSREWLKVLTVPERRGKGAALRHGFAHATHETLAFADADLEVPLTFLPDLLARAGERRVIIGHRVDRRASPSRRVLSFGYRVLTRLLLGVAVKDVGCPLKVFPRTLVEAPPLRSDGWVIDAEILANAKRGGYEIVELPVTAADCPGRESHVRPLGSGVSGVLGLAKLLLPRK